MKNIKEIKIYAVVVEEFNQILFEGITKNQFSLGIFYDYLSCKPRRNVRPVFTGSQTCSTFRIISHLTKLKGGRRVYVHLEL